MLEKDNYKELNKWGDHTIEWNDAANALIWQANNLGQENENYQELHKCGDHLVPQTQLTRKWH